jgi:hypothetical protein
MTTLFRIDTEALQADAAEKLLRPESGPAGCLMMSGYIARPGIYLYNDGAGGIRRELVPKANLWRQDSLNTLARTPVTLEHPPELVTPENSSKYTVGDVDGRITKDDNGFVRILLAVRDQVALDAIAGGKHQLSPGYRVVLDETPGEDEEFGRYDAIQVSRDYNHVALVDAARGGPDIRVRIDAEDVDVLVGHREDSKYIHKHTADVTETTEYDDDGNEVITTKSKIVDAFRREDGTARYDIDAPVTVGVLENAMAMVMAQLGQIQAHLEKKSEDDATAALAEPANPPANPAAVPTPPTAEEDPTAQTPPETPPGADPATEGAVAPDEAPPEGAVPAEEGAAAPAEEAPPAAAAAPPGVPPKKEEEEPPARKDGLTLLVEDPTRFLAVKNRLDGIARSVSITYDSSMPIQDLARLIVEKASPGIVLYSDSEYIAAAQVVNIDTLDVPKPSGRGNTFSPSRSVYGPRTDQT